MTIYTSRANNKERFAAFREGLFSEIFKSLSCELKGCKVLSLNNEKKSYYFGIGFWLL
jgi:hypothetical protein